MLRNKHITTGMAATFGWGLLLPRGVCFTVDF